MTPPTWSIDLRGARVDPLLSEQITKAVADVLRDAPAVTDFIGTVVEMRASEVLGARLLVRVEREDPMVALGGRTEATAVVWLGNPPIQSMSKTHEAQAREHRRRRAAEDLARSVEDATRRSLKATQTQLENLAKARAEKARRAALQLGHNLLDALAQRLPWIASWEVESETVWIAETSAGSVTFENLVDLATALATRNINIAGAINHGWYPEDDTADVKLEVRGDNLRAAVEALAVPQESP